MPQDWSDDIMVEKSFGEKEVICMTVNLQIAQTAGTLTMFYTV